MRRSLVVGFACLAACSGTSAPSPSPDAGAKSDAIALLRATPGLEVARDLDGTLVARSGGFVRERAATAWRTLGGTLEATLPARANAPLHLGVDDARDVWLELRDDSLLDAEGAREGSAIVFRDAQPGVDVVHVAGNASVEELRIVRAPTANAHLTWKLGRGPSLGRIAVEGDVVRAYDLGDRARFATKPAFAVDARGTRFPMKLRVDGDTLVADVALEGAVAPVIIDPTWTSVSGMITPRYSFPLFVSSTGTVFATGGATGGPSVSIAAESWTESGGWASLPDLPQAMGNHTGVMSATGPVLFGGAGMLATYRWNGSGWTTLGSWTTSRFDSLALYEPTTDEVFVFGGANGGPALKTGLKMSGTTWTAIADMSVGRRGPCGARLSANKFLVVGGEGLSSAEIYDATSNTWSAAGALSQARWRCAAVEMSGGIVVAGGVVGFGSSTTVDFFTTSSKTWSTQPSLKYPRSMSAGIPLSTGKILFAGGDQTTAEVWDSADGGSYAGDLVNVDMRVVGLSGNRALAVGGRDPSALTVNNKVQIWAQLANGAACTAAGECASGECVDGVCCDTPCTESCKACNLPTTKGTCTAVTGLPVGDRNCGAYKYCEAGSCKTTCGGDSDCTSTQYCAAGACVPKKFYGGSCDRDAMCSVGTCADGVCCNTACTGQCEYCADPSSLGTCIAVVGAPRTGHPACVGSAFGTTCGIRCDGTNRGTCTYPTASTPCGSNACSGGTETHASNCTGTGTCGDVPSSCGAYTCGSTKCNTSCGSGAPCASGFYCSTGTCVPLEGTGKACTDSSSCSTGLTCVDGVCCGSSSCASGESCALPKTLGRCAKKLGQPCTTADSCGSGVCVDGVCCDRACTGQCEACDAKDNVGTCTPITGDPHGSRDKCGTGGGDECKALTCNGAKDPNSCVAYKNGTDTICKAASCSGSTFTEASTCDGVGGCKAPPTTSCVPFACDDKGCLKTCTTNAQCAEGYSCSAGACVQGARCTDDMTASIPKGGGDPVSCQAYRCGTNGECLTVCTSTNDCAAGFVCDPSKTCVAAASSPTEDDGGGCTTGRSTARAPGVFLLLGLLALRRRARSRAE